MYTFAGGFSPLNFRHSAQDTWMWSISWLAAAEAVALRGGIVPTKPTLRLVSARMNARSNIGNTGAKHLLQSTPMSKGNLPVQDLRRAVEMVHRHSSSKRVKFPLLQDTLRRGHSEEMSSSPSSQSKRWEYISGLPTKSVLKCHTSRGWCLESTWVWGHSGSRTMGISCFEIAKLHSSAVKCEAYFRKPLMINPLSETSGGIASNSK